MNLTITSLTVPVFNVIRFIVYTLILAPIFERVLAWLFVKWASAHFVSGERIRWRESRAGPFGLHGKYFSTGSRSVLYVLAVTFVIASLFSEFAFDSEQVTQWSTCKVRKKVTGNLTAPEISFEYQENLFSEVMDRQQANINFQLLEPSYSFQYGDQYLANYSKRYVVGPDGKKKIKGGRSFNFSVEQIHDVIRDTGEITWKEREVMSGTTYTPGFIKMYRTDSWFNQTKTRERFPITHDISISITHMLTYAFEERQEESCVAGYTNDDNYFCLSAHKGGLVGRLGTYADGEVKDVRNILDVVFHTQKGKADENMSHFELLLKLTFARPFQSLLSGASSRRTAEERAYNYAEVAKSLVSVASGIKLSRTTEMQTATCPGNKVSRPTVDVAFAMPLILYLTVLTALSAIARMVISIKLRRIKFPADAGFSQSADDVRIGDDAEYILDLIKSGKSCDGMCYNPKTSQEAVVIEDTGGQFAHITTSEHSSVKMELPLR